MFLLASIYCLGWGSGDEKTNHGQEGVPKKGSRSHGKHIWTTLNEVKLGEAKYSTRKGDFQLTELLTEYVIQHALSVR